VPLSAGSIAIVSYNSDTNKIFSFVALTDIPAGEAIKFTDNGWTSAGAFRANEGVITWTPPAAGVTKGTVITINTTGAVTATSGTVTETGDVNMSTAGDQLLAYQGADSSPTFLFAINNEGAAVWQSTASDSNTSALPTGLTNGTNAVALTEIDNARYNGPTSGTAAELLAAISNRSNWVGDDAVNQTGPSSFTVSGGGGATTVSINDVSVVEGDAGTQTLTFTVTRSDNTTEFSLGFETADGSAVNPSDYASTAGTLNFTVGGALTQTISVTVNGDTTAEADETFTVNLNNLVQTIGTTSLTDASGLGTIQNNDVALTSIYTIQGAGHKSSFVGGAIGASGNSGATRVTTEGVVTAISFNGFYIQDAAGDGDINTSDGIFVFTSSAPAGTIAVGETVRVTARVDEFRPSNSNNLTLTQLNATASGSSIVELGGFTDITEVVLGVDRVIPSAVIDNDNFVTFDPNQDAVDFWESLEGMAVTVPSSVAVSGTSREASGGTFNEEFWVRLSTDADAASLNGRGGLTIADGDFNPQRIQIDDIDRAIDMPQVTTGTVLGSITGVVSYDDANYEIAVSTAPVVSQASTITKEVTALTASARQVTVATFNVENLDPNDADGDADIASGKFAAIADAIVTNLKSPTVVALQEMQDNSGSTNNGVTSASLTAQTLIDAIVAAGGPVYTYADIAPANNTSGGQNGANIRVGYLYLADQVTLTGLTQITDPNPGAVDGHAGNDFAGSRIPLAAEFARIDNGVSFTVINNHFNSKGGDNALFGNAQPPVLGSEAQRTEQALNVAAYVQGLEGANASQYILVVGDLNDFAFSTPVETLLSAGLSDLAEEFIGNAADRYSYIFQGNSQSLDQTLANAHAVNTTAAGFDIVHINADFSDSDRVSDHDPSVTLLDLRQESEALNGGAANDSIFGFGGIDIISGGLGSDTLDGGLGADTLSGGAGNDILIGGASSDSMTGGAGSDRFVLSGAGAGHDAIWDFTGARNRASPFDAPDADVLVLARAELGLASTVGFGGAGIQLISLADAAAGVVGTGAAGYLIFDRSGADAGSLYWDATGGGATDRDLLAQLSGVTQIGMWNFSLI
jgi:uncharacterized protein